MKDVFEKTLALNQGIHAPFRLKMEQKMAKQVKKCVSCSSV